MAPPTFDQDEWESYEFNVHPKNRDSFLLNSIKPIIDELEEDDCLNNFHFRRSTEGVTLRVNAKTDIQAVVKEHTKQDPVTVTDNEWRENDMAAGDYGARMMIQERERLSRVALDVLEADQSGKEINIFAFMARQSHMATNMHGAYLNVAKTLDMTDRVMHLKPERRG